MCDFEEADFCNWSNEPGSDFDWLLNSGSTMAKHSGPEFDHTLASTEGIYIYIESSMLNAQEGWAARLISEPFTNSIGNCMSFWYHMYGNVTIWSFLIFFNVFKSLCFS